MDTAKETSRLALFEQLVRGMHTARTSREVLDTFSVSMARVYRPLCYAEVALDGAGEGRYFVTRLCRHDGTECVPDRSPFEVGTCESSAGGLFGRIAAAAQHAVFDPDVRVGADDPFAAHLIGYRAMMAAPIYTAGQPEWCVLLAEDASYFEGLTLEDYMLRCNLVGAIIESMRVTERLVAAQQQITAEIERIARIQRALLPVENPVVKGLDVAFRVSSYDRAGGDLVDFDGIHEDAFGIIVADASGHGISAAVVAAMLSAIMHAYPTSHMTTEIPEMGEVGRVMEFANRHLCEKRIEDSFVTAFVAGWRPSTRALEYSRSGHPPPMLRRARTGEVEEIADSAGLPLGIMDDSRYTSRRIVLEPGDVLVIYTDGISEAANASGEQFGEARLAEVVRAGGDPWAMLSRIEAAVAAFTGLAPVGDDRTLVVLRVQ